MNYKKIIICILAVSVFLCNAVEKKLHARQTKYISAGHAKIAVVGTGFVGATVAYALMLKNVAAELILVDINEQLCEGQVLDLSDAISFCYASHVRKGTLEEASHADIIIITAGIPGKPEQTRLDLIKTNHEILISIMHGLGSINPRAVILVISNPVDVMTYLAQELSDLPKNQIFGSGTLLDSQRLCGTLSARIGVSQQSIQAYILGEHGDSQFPAWSSARIAGIPITSFAQMTQNNLDNIAQTARTKAYEIIKNKGATYYGIGVCAADICENIVFNQQRIMPVSSYIDELGVCLSMPTIVGENGIEHVLPIPLDEKEKQLLQHSAKTLRDVIDSLR